MKPQSLGPLLFSSLFLLPALASADIKVAVEHNSNDHASAAFRFKNIPSPSKTNLATKASFALVSGELDENGGTLAQLHDGSLPGQEDDPAANSFFAAGSDGGRILIDLGTPHDIGQVNSYSWHPNTRGPQVYQLYAADGTAPGFQPKPVADAPEKVGWKLIAKVDTRPASGDPGGQYGVCVSDDAGTLGQFRYLLLAVSPTEKDDAFGNTFYSEINVVEKGAGTAPGQVVGADEPPFVTHSTDGVCQISIDTGAAPELKEWAQTKLAPLLAEWYPKLTAMLPSEGFNPPVRFSVTLKPGNGVAATGGGRITANSTWVKRELNGEALGALLHEEVHVVQRYGGGRRGGGPRVNIGWLTEGIPDYIRFFLYEPQTHGADATYFRRRRVADLRYDGLYRVSANFLNYVVEHYDKEKKLIATVNAACRQGKYTEDLWKDLTGHTINELNDEWKAELFKETGQTAPAPAANPAKTATPAGATTTPATASSEANQLTKEEQAAGWKLLFNGADFTGWHNFRREGVREGWQVKDGLLVCADPSKAGDIVTAEAFEWFELELDYNISHAGNSGIMFHVANTGGAVWATGPEFQLEDNQAAADQIRCGWLYALYQPPDDPKTGKPLDATKPVGEWNHVRLLVSKEKCEHDINGVKYFEYVLGSDDFNARVAKSKFARMPGFAKSPSGFIALQGDHGSVSFRNIKVRPITSN